MATFQKRGGKWRALVRVSGHPAESKTFSSRTSARAWAAKIEDAIRDGSLPGQEARRTFGELLDEYQRELWQRKLRSEGEIERHLADWRKAFGAYAIGRVTPAMIAKEGNDLMERVGPATVNRRLASRA